MSRRAKILVLLAIAGCVGLVVALLMAPRIRARMIEAQLPPNPGRSAKPGDWVAYVITRSFATGGSASASRSYELTKNDGRTLKCQLSDSEFAKPSQVPASVEVERPLDSWLNGLFPSTRHDWKTHFEIAEEVRRVNGRSFACTRISARTGEGAMDRTVTYWLSPEVKLLGYVGRRIAYENGNAEDELVSAWGHGDVVEWGSTDH